MYFVINRLDEERLARMEFLVNFGVTLDNIRAFSEAMANGGLYEEVKSKTFQKLELV